MNRPAPRSIDEYLQQLRAALAGEDRAVIHDALYDAEEYLRAELAANPGKPEAEVLEHIAGTYGTPDEVATGYRDTEVKVKAALRPTAPRRAYEPNAVERFFSIYSDPRAYVSLLFMFLSLVTGILYFTFAVTGLSLSLGLAILIIGLPMFIAFIGIARAISLGESRLLEAVSGERMARRPVHPGAPDGLWRRIVAMLQDVQTWTTLVYFVLMLPIGIAYFTFAVTVIAVGASFLLVPVAGIFQRKGLWTPWYESVGTIRFSPEWLDTPMGWIFCLMVGIFILTALLHVARGVVVVHARIAKALLVTPGV